MALSWNRESQPARAVWIEIYPYHVRGGDGRCHSLRGLCGLKSILPVGFQEHMESQPARAVWIEIFLR